MKGSLVFGVGGRLRDAISIEGLRSGLTGLERHFEDVSRRGRG